MRGDGSVRIDDIERHWWYDKNNYPPQTHPFELIQNPEIVHKKGRPKGAIGITASKRLEKSTKQDSSQFKLVNTAISRDISSRKRIYKIGKKEGRLKATPKIITKPISSLKKQKRKKMAVEIPEKTM